MQKRAGSGQFEISPWLRYPVKRDFVPLSIILLAAAAVRLAGLNEPGLWLDEVSYTLAAQKPILSQIVNSTETLGDYLSVDPTLSAIPFSLALKLGFSNFLVRFPAAIFGILGVALIYQLGRTLFGNRVGLLAAFLLSLSSFHILYSQEGRSYTQLVFFSLASFLFLYRAASSGKSKHWLFYGVCTWAAVSTNHLMLFAVAAQAFFLAAVGLLAIFQQKRDLAVIKEQSKILFSFCLSLLAVFLLRTPWLEDFTRRQCAGCAIGRPSYTLDLAGSFIQSMQAFIGSSHSVIGAVFLILAGLSLLLMLPAFPRQGIFLISWSGLSIVMTTFGLWFISQFFHPRYTIWGLPAFLLSLAFGLVWAGSYVQKIWRAKGPETATGSSPQRAGLLFISLLLIPVVVINLNQMQQQVAFKQSWPRGMLEEATNVIVAGAQPEESVIAIGLPARHLRFYAERNRQDLTYFDDQSFVEKQRRQTLPPELAGRWYVIHNSYAAPRIPGDWPDTRRFYAFHDLVVVYQPAPCRLADCIEETKMLLAEISGANPGSSLEAIINQIMVGFAQLKY